MKTEISVHPFEQDGKYGFRNEETYETVIPAKYEKVKDNYNVQLNGKWGIVNRSGVEIVPPKYDYISHWGDDGNVVRLNGKYGFINEHGREFIPPQYELAYNFVLVNDQWRAAVQQNYKWGFINLEGKTVVPCRYEAVKSFASSYIPIPEGLTAVQLSSKWGFIDVNGKLVISCDYTEVRSFLNGRAAVKKFGKWGYVDVNGRQVVPFIYDLAGDFDFYTKRANVTLGKQMFFIKENGERDEAALDDAFKHQPWGGYGDIMCVEIGDKYGYVNKSGDIVIPFIYDAGNRVTQYHDENIAVTLNGKKQLFGKDGIARTPLIYDDISIPDRHSMRDYIAVRSNGKWGYVNDEGKKVIPCRYDDASDFIHEYAAKTGIAKVIYEGRLQFIDTSGNPLPDRFSQLPFSEGLAAVEMNKRYGYVDETGKVIIPFIYEEPNHNHFREIDQMRFHRGRARVKSADIYDKIGCIDKTGRLVVPFISDDKIDYSVDDDWMITYWRVDDNDVGQKEWHPRLFNIRGKKIVPEGWEIISDFAEGLAAVRNTKWDRGYIDKTGKIVIPLYFSKARGFINGLAAVSEDGSSWGFIDKTGKMVIPCNYWWSGCHTGNDEFDENGLKLVSGYGDAYEKWGWINKTGKIVIPLIYGDAKNFIDGKARVTKNRKTYYIDRNGMRL